MQNAPPAPARAHRFVASTPMAVSGPDRRADIAGRPREMVLLGGLDYGPDFTSARDLEQDVLPKLLA